MALPALTALSQQLPSARIDVFVGSHSRAVFDGQPAVSRIRPCPERLRATDAARLGMSLRRPAYAQAVIFDRSRWLRTACSLARIPDVLQAQPRRPEERHESEVYLDVVRDLGWSGQPTLPSLLLDPWHIAAADALRPSSSPFVVVHPGGGDNPGTYMPDKRWPAERFVELARWMRAQGRDVLLTGSRYEHALATTIADGAMLPEQAVVAGRCDLMTTAALIRKADLFVGGDTGVSHIAGAVGTPVVALFGPTNPLRYRPLGPLVKVVAPEASWHIPDTDLRKTRVHRDLPSIALISVSDVVEACQDVLRRRSGAP
jgi:heptosyltransferase-2